MCLKVNIPTLLLFLKILLSELALNFKKSFLDQNSI